jgi:hypothetical protein
MTALGLGCRLLLKEMPTLKIDDRVLSSQAMTPNSVDAWNSRDTAPIPENWFMSRNSDPRLIGNFG